MVFFSNPCYTIFVMDFFSVIHLVPFLLSFVKQAETILFSCCEAACTEMKPIPFVWCHSKILQLNIYNNLIKIHSNLLLFHLFYFQGRIIKMPRNVSSCCFLVFLLKVQ